MPMSPRLLRPRAAGGFDPRAIAGLVAWYDASDLSTLFQNSNGTTAAVAENDPVGHVRDKGPNGYHMTQTTNNSRPLLKLSAQNGLTALLFDGSNDHLINATAFLNGSPFGVALVAQRQADTSIASVFSSGRLGASAPEVPASANLRNTFNAAGSINTFSTSNARRNGSATLQTGNSPTGFMIGTGSSVASINAGTAGDGVILGDARASGGDLGFFGGLNGRIGEIVFYRKTLSLDERQMLERYLSAKWGIALT